MTPKTHLHHQFWLIQLFKTIYLFYQILTGSQVLISSEGQLGADAQPAVVAASLRKHREVLLRAIGISAPLVSIIS